MIPAPREKPKMESTPPKTPDDLWLKIREWFGRDTTLIGAITAARAGPA